MVAVIFTLISSGTVWAWHILDVLPGAFGLMSYGIVIHGGILPFFLLRFIRKTAAPGRINGLMILALTYAIWFGIIPLLNYNSV